MENIKNAVENGLSVIEGLQPLLDGNSKPKKTRAEKAIRKTYKGTAHLANLLPTGCAFAINMLSPVFTQQGTCSNPINKTLTLTLLGLCFLTCFCLRFTDSFKDERGKVRHGVATFHGMWIIDGSKVKVPEDVGEKHRLRFIDFFHGFMSVLVFGTVALFDQNIVRCFYPMPSEREKMVLAGLPVGVGVICSLLFVVFPTKRHGIGFPLSRD